MNVSFRAGQRTKSRYKSLAEAYLTRRRPVYVICGRKAHLLPETLIVHWSDGAFSASTLYVGGVRQNRVPREAWWEVPVLRLQPQYAELRTEDKRVRWKEGRLK